MREKSDNDSDNDLFCVYYIEEQNADKSYTLEYKLSIKEKEKVYTNMYAKVAPTLQRIREQREGRATLRNRTRRKLSLAPTRMKTMASS